MSDEVVIIDDVLLPVGEADSWLRNWRSDYLPHARDRGMELRGVWRGWTREPANVSIVVHWTLPTVDAFWSARNKAAHDTTIGDFWARTDGIAVARDRRVFAADTLVE